MKKIIMTMILFASLSCGDDVNEEYFAQSQFEQSESSIIVDYSKISIFPLDSTNEWLIKEGKPVKLEEEEFKIIEKALIKKIKAYNQVQEERYLKMKETHPDFTFELEDFLIELEVYRRQYIPYRNTEMDKEVWINCYCRDFDSDFASNILIVKDGGKCFFNLKINLAKKKAFDFMVNGEA